MKPLVSIVVPVYNVKEYLPKCLESLARQSYEQIEIIIVDDYSKDNSKEIINKFMAYDKRIKLIENKKIWELYTQDLLVL